MDSDLERDTAKAAIMALRREVNDLRNRCDEIFHALACALAVPVDAETGDAVHSREQHLIDWARSFMNAKMACDVARVASTKYIHTDVAPCHHDWSYSHNKGGMQCGNCGEFISDAI